MPVLLILASLVIMVGVVAVAIGRGGEMAEFAGDYPPFDTDDLLTAADVALLRPPTALWGYNAAATDQALGRIAQVVTERDVEIAALRKQLAEIRAATGYSTGTFQAIGSSGSTGSFGAVRSPGASRSSGSTGSFGAAGSSDAAGPGGTGPGGTGPGGTGSGGTGPSGVTGPSGTTGSSGVTGPSGTTESSGAVTFGSARRSAPRSAPRPAPRSAPPSAPPPSPAPVSPPTHTPTADGETGPDA